MPAVPGCPPTISESAAAERKKTSMSSDFAHALEVVTAGKKSQDPSVSVVVRWARLLPRGGGVHLL